MHWLGRRSSLCPCRRCKDWASLGGMVCALLPVCVCVLLSHMSLGEPLPISVLDSMSQSRSLHSLQLYYTLFGGSSVRKKMPTRLEGKLDAVSCTGREGGSTPIHQESRGVFLSQNRQLVVCLPDIHARLQPSDALLQCTCFAASDLGSHQGRFCRAASVHWKDITCTQQPVFETSHARLIFYLPSTVPKRCFSPNFQTPHGQHTP